MHPTHKKAEPKSNNRLIKTGAFRASTTREMKSEKISRIEEFWDWFRSVAATLAANVEAPKLVEELDSRVDNLDPKLSWEIGPGLSEPWQLVISPNLNQDLREEARTIVSYAPSIDGWQFHSAKPPKEWDYTLELETEDGGLVRLDASTWTFVLLRYPDGTHEVLIKGNGVSHLRNDERWQAAAITLENILGEDLFLDRINKFELVDQLEPRFAERQRPIRALHRAVTAN
jgi:hypothetical protein